MKDKITEHGQLLDSTNYKALIEAHANTEVPSFLQCRLDSTKTINKNYGTKPKTLTLKPNKKVFKSKVNDGEE